LQSIGLKVHLGHHGHCCPFPSTENKNFTVIDTSGVHNVTLVFCGCVGAAAEHPRVQLLRVNWFPASVDRPESAFTFDVLDSFHLVTLQGKISAYDFYYSLAHKSDNVGLLKLRVGSYIFCDFPYN
jgi:hypothetical protein